MPHTTPVLTLLAAPRVGNTATQSASTEDTRPFFNWEPPPPPPGPPPPLSKPEDEQQCDSSSVDQGPLQAQNRLSETSNVSPSQSSRASTVFCPPWDTAPIGLYLSDLINLSRPLHGSTDGSGTSDRVRDSMLRRRTLSALEHRWLGERLSSLIDTNTAGRTEFQKLLGMWMQSNQTERVEKEQESGDETVPPPLPQRRRRTRGQKGSVTAGNVLDQLRPGDVKVTVTSGIH